MERGEEYLNSQQYREAVIEFKNAVKAVPDNPQAHYKLGDAYIRTGVQQNVKQGFKELTRAVDLDPGLLDAQLMLGELYLLSRNFDEGLQKAELILQKEPNHLGGRMLMANSLARKNELKKAIARSEEHTSELQSH